MLNCKSDQKMLNLFNLKEKRKIIETGSKKYEKVNIKVAENNNSSLKKTNKHYPSPLREWKNSIYVYNKNNLDLIPSTTVSINNIIKSYFNLFNKKIEAKVRWKKLSLRLRKFSTNKFYISNGGFKHTNNKVLINLFVFNRQKINYLLALKNWYLNEFLKKTTISNNENINISLIKRLKLINKKGIQAVKNLNKDKILLIKALNSVLNNKNFVNRVNTFKGLSNYTEIFYKNLINKSLKKIKMYFYYKQLLYINKSKLNYTYLQYLKKHVEKIYNKNVEFNLINIKHFYLDSDILFEPITTKISQNRKKITIFLKKLKDKIKIKVKHPYAKPIKHNIKQNTILNQLSLKNHIMNNLKYKDVTGFRLQVKGRLNRRFTASRSAKKVIYKGSLLDIDSSYQGLSTVLLKGNLKSNTQKTKVNSKSRVGSFGVTGWISGNW